ncbi:MAG: GNAT family N-acetyltransferase [Planctomycetota bacterium]
MARRRRYDPPAGDGRPAHQVRSPDPGAGAALIREMESIVRVWGGTRLYLGVDPVDNPRAQELYLRLGYKPLQTEPHRSRWKFTDSDGTVHQGDEWSVDMVKDLGARPLGEPGYPAE